MTWDTRRVGIWENNRFFFVASFQRERFLLDISWLVYLPWILWNIHMLFLMRSYLTSWITVCSSIYKLTGLLMYTVAHNTRSSCFPRRKSSWRQLSDIHAKSIWELPLIFFPFLALLTINLMQCHSISPRVLLLKGSRIDADGVNVLEDAGRNRWMKTWRSKN